MRLKNKNTMTWSNFTAMHKIGIFKVVVKCKHSELKHQFSNIVKT